mgnify:CR=1 FL=1
MDECTVPVVRDMGESNAVVVDRVTAMVTEL